jgi:PAS domain S-box-containing protein
MLNKPTYEELEQRVKELEQLNAEHQQSKRELNENKELSSKFFHSSPVGIVITTLKDGKVIDTNKSFMNCTGHKKEESIGHTSSELGFWIGPGDWGEVTDKLKTNGSFQDLEFKFRHKSGKVKWGSFSAEIITIKNERCIITTLSDITEQKKSEEALQKNEEKLNLFMNSATDSFGIYDSSFNLIDLNESGLKWWPVGTKKEDLIGKNLLELAPNLKNSERYEKYLDVIRTGKPMHDLDIITHTKFGKISLEVKAFKVGDGMGLITHNITERKRAAEELKRYKEHLEELVDERTSELKTANEQLRQETTQRKQTEDALQQIEWLLIKDTDTTRLEKNLTCQGYGDLSELNTCRKILDSVGAEVLKSIVGDYLDLLDTSSAVYEENGDYAMGIFSSGWCQFLDQASRDLCETNDNQKALESGKWLCHESCWSNVSKVSIETGQPADIECEGGIHLYALPIFVGEKPIGSINFGYSDPPKDLKKLRKIADKYHVNIDKLKELANQYETRPSFIIETAKKRLSTSTKLIGEIVKRKLVEKDLNRYKEQLEVMVKERTTELEKEIAEHKQAREALRESEFFFSQMFEQSTTSTCLYNPEGIIIKVNPEFCKLFGVKDKTIIEGKFNEFKNRATIDAGIVPILREIFDKKKTKDWETSYDIDVAIKSKGTPSSRSGQIILEVFGYPIIDSDGHLKHVVLQHYDITDRKRVNEALLESRERLELALKGADLGMWDWDLENDSYIFNTRTEELLGYTSPSKSEDWFKRIHPDDLKRAKENDEVVVKGQSEIIDHDYRYISKTGEVRWIHSWGRVVEWNRDGNPIRATGTMHDITKEKKIEEALVKSELNLKRGQRISKIGSWYYDRATDNEIWSDECFELFGLKKDNYPDNVVPVALSYSFFAEPKKTAELSTFLAEKNDIYDLEFTTIPINGQVKTIHSYCEVEKDNEGNLLKVFGSDQDVTEQKMMENQLIKAKEQADEANKTKSEFLSNISHELRTPMQGIIGFSNLAIKRFKSTKKAKLLEYFSSIHSSGRRLLALLNDLLDLSRLEAGMVVYNLEKSKMSELIFNAINGLKSLAKEKNIRIEFQPSKFADVVTLDKEIITQLIVNLLSNAIKFSEPGSEIRVESDSRDESFCLSVIDKGIGVPNNELESIFDKFIQSSKTKTGAGGTGLGLAICKEIIQAHNGKIWAENNPEGGATFSFILPYEQYSQ